MRIPAKWSGQHQKGVRVMSAVRFACEVGDDIVAASPLPRTNTLSSYVNNWYQLAYDTII